ncbi:histidine phosphatase family protein [Psychrobacillus sp. Sa2BUA9]|uniref:Histidine phosphatase family protein n=1 Tax=Psychrobacillus faecigallinarum TaxID=2762235 RepID=A0ABR8R8J3_9BACI|nr:histidine phosphatase family protein [Psychrobacillus faecigallinarum]
MRAGLKDIIQSYPNKKKILVAHGAVINAILALLSDSKIGSGKTKLLNACISNLEYKQDRWKVKDYNQTTHLTK